MTSQKSLKTALRYPGGKSRACVKMDPYFPDLRNYDEFREPFLGGGSVAIYITKKYPNLDIWVNDLYEPLVNFWQQLQMFGVDMKDKLVELKTANNTPELAKDLFLSSKEKVNDQDVPSIDRAVAFYVVNKCSFSGLTESSSFSQQASVSNFSMRGIEKLPAYSKLIEKWRITNYSYDYLLDGETSAFVYLDPPYDIKDNLYGRKGSMHKGFDHDKFAADCDANNMDQLVSYNSDQLVKDRFKNWNAAEFDLTYTMRSVGEYMREQKNRKELLLFNYGIEGLVEQYQSDEREPD
jgi:site-specific DNA-adenine methylase